MSYAERRNGRLTGRWVCDADFKHPDSPTTRWHKAFPSKGAADEAEAYYRATGNPPPSLGAPTRSFGTVAEAFRLRNKDWFDRDTSASQSNTQRFEYAVAHLGKLDIAAITRTELERFVDALVRKGCANRTVNRYLDAVMKVLKFAADHQHITHIPRMPRMPDKGIDRHALTEAQERVLCESMERRGKGVYAFLVHVLAEAGLRTGELWKLTPEQIEARGILLQKEQTKTHATRWVPLHPEACRKLRALIASGTMPDYAQLRSVFRATLKHCGETDRLSLYSLRHASITRKLAAGISPIDVAKIHGHSNIQTTKGYYHPDRDTLAAVVEKVPSVFGETPQSGAVVPFPGRVKSTA